jgi:hypothetical protein
MLTYSKCRTNENVLNRAIFVGPQIVLQYRGSLQRLVCPTELIWHGFLAIVVFLEMKKIDALIRMGSSIVSLLMCQV